MAVASDVWGGLFGIWGACVLVQERDGSSLVGLAKAGDFDAFEELVTRQERAVYAAAMRILRRHEDAEDVVQTTFLKALEHLGNFREEASFGTWVRRIAVNTALKVLRKQKGLATVSLDEATSPNDEGEVRHPDYVAAWRDDPADLVGRRDTARILDEAIEELSEKHRVVFILRDIEEMSVRETAEALGITQANVKVRLLRARLALRETLTRLFGDDQRRAQKTDGHGGGRRATPVQELLRSYQTS